MWYFGTNIDNRFTVPDLWPKPEQTHRIPFEKEDIRAELERLRKRRLEVRERRLARERVEKETRGGEGENEDTRAGGG